MASEERAAVEHESVGFTCWITLSLPRTREGAAHIETPVISDVRVFLKHMTLKIFKFLCDFDFYSVTV